MKQLIEEYGVGAALLLLGSGILAALVQFLALLAEV